MTDDTITSRKNQFAQRARAVRDGRERELVFVEGVRLCEEALRSPVEFESVLYARDLADEERGASLLGKLRDACPNTYAVSDDVLESVSDTKAPQGVVALARRPPTGREILERDTGVPLVVVMHRANNP